MERLTGPLASTLKRKAMRPLPWTIRANPHCRDIDDPRKVVALRDGTLVDRFTR
jgi:hypothetical protein